MHELAHAISVNIGVPISPNPLLIAGPDHPKATLAFAHDLVVQLPGKAQDLFHISLGNLEQSDHPR